MICALVSLLTLSSSRSLAQATDLGSEEAKYYQILDIPLPDGTAFEPGALLTLPNGKLAFATRLGDIYFISGHLQTNASALKFERFASGLHEVLGLAFQDGWLYVTQRGEVSRLRDRDGDGRADLFETVNDEWGINGDYHEYAFGSKFDREGNIWVALCLTGSFTSENRFRGWALRITPEGKMIPTTSGLRSPGGIGANAIGDMFFTENQGPWNGACALKHLVPGAFVGNPSGNVWYKDPAVKFPRPADPKSGSRVHLEAEKIPELIPPAVLFPYNKMGQSASGIACDLTSGKFGPFKGQLFVGDQTHSTVMRVFLEKVNGRYQGAAFPFREGFASGNLSLEFVQDGSLMVAGTDRGWGARGGKPFALQRLVWTGKTPFEILEMRAIAEGFEFTFTGPAELKSLTDSASYTLESYTYIYQANYGSPEVDRTKPVIKSLQPGADKKSVRMQLDTLHRGHVYEVHLKGVRSAEGSPLLHSAAYYTLNNIAFP